MTQHNKHPRRTKGAGVHKDWRIWTAVVLMLVAMAVYVLTMDESIEPGEAPQQSAEELGVE